MSKTLWFVVISILMVGTALTGCASVKSVDRWLSQPTDIHDAAAYYGTQPVVFANVWSRNLTLTIKVRNIRDRVWLDALTLSPRQSALIYYGEGKYYWVATSVATRKKVADGHIFVPARGRPYLFDGDRYAAGVVIGAPRRVR